MREITVPPPAASDPRAPRIAVSAADGSLHLRSLTKQWIRSRLSESHHLAPECYLRLCIYSTGTQRFTASEKVVTGVSLDQVQPGGVFFLDFFGGCGCAAGGSAGEPRSQCDSGTV